MKQRYCTRIRPGGVLVIPPPLLRKLGGDSTKLIVEQQGNRLVVSKRPTVTESRIATLKAWNAKKSRLVGLQMQMPDVGREDDFERLN